jgi:HNH endonuclease
MASWAPEHQFASEGDWAPHGASQPDWKPQKRIRATKNEREALEKHFEHHPCVHCGMAHQHLHHIAFRSEGGGDVVENLAPICFSCHDLFHKRAPGWEQVAVSIRQYVMVDNHRRHYAENILGERFNRRYPALPNLDPQFLEDFEAIKRGRSRRGYE